MSCLSSDDVALWDELVWWSALALAQLAALAGAPSFYNHYTGFAVPALCLFAGYGVYVLWENVSGIRVRRLVTVVAVVGSAAMAMALVGWSPVGMPNFRNSRQLLPGMTACGCMILPP